MARFAAATLAIFDLLCGSTALTYGIVEHLGGDDNVIGSRPSANGGVPQVVPVLSVPQDLGIKTNEIARKMGINTDIDKQLTDYQRGGDVRMSASIEERTVKNSPKLKTINEDDEEAASSEDSPESETNNNPKPTDDASRGRVLKRTTAARDLNKLIEEEEAVAEENAPKTKSAMKRALEALCVGGSCGKGKNSKDEKEEDNSAIAAPLVSENTLSEQNARLKTLADKNTPFFVGGAVGAASGIASGIYGPMGTLGVTPTTDAAITGAIAGGAMGVFPALEQAALGTSLGERIYNLESTVVGAASYGAGLAAGVSAIKQDYLKTRGQQCTPLPVQENFDILQYISATWYPQYQNPQNFQKGDQINCGNATYSAKTGGLWGWDVDVLNMGYGISTNEGFLCAEQQQGAKLVVGPCMTPTSMGSPYWVANYSESAGHAIVMGGQPERYDAATGKCGYSRNMTNGMWIFSRTKVPSTAQMAVIDGLKDYLGNTLNYDTSEMVRVDQVNC